MTPRPVRRRDVFLWEVLRFLLGASQRWFLSGKVTSFSGVYVSDPSPHEKQSSSSISRGRCFSPGRTPSETRDRSPCPALPHRTSCTKGQTLGGCGLPAGFSPAPSLPEARAKGLNHSLTQGPHSICSPTYHVIFTLFVSSASGGFPFFLENLAKNSHFPLLLNPAFPSVCSRRGFKGLGLPSWQN